MVNRIPLRSKSVIDRRQPSWNIFDYYCRQQFQQKKYSTFDQLQNNLHMLHIRKFGLILKHLSLNLSWQEVTSTFQSHSISHVMNYRLFEEALAQVRQNHNPNINQKIKQLALKIENRNRNIVELSKSQLKVSSRPGKDTKGIIQQLEQSKKNNQLGQVLISPRQTPILQKIDKNEINIVKYKSMEGQKNRNCQMPLRLFVSNSKRKHKSLNLSSTIDKAKIQSLIMHSDDQILNSLQIHKSKQLMGQTRRIQLLKYSKLVADQVGQLQNYHEKRNLATINRFQIKNMQLGSRIINKYKN